MHPVRMGAARGLGLTYLARRIGESWWTQKWWTNGTKDRSLVEVVLPALFGLSLDVLHLLLELLGTCVLGGLEDATKGAAGEVVLDHALGLADGTLLLAGERGGQVELGCGAFAFAHG